MKKTVFIQDTYKSEDGNFMIIVSTNSPKMKGDLEIMSSEKVREIKLSRYSTGGILITNQTELTELMLLLSEFSETLHQEEKVA